MVSKDPNSDFDDLIQLFCVTDESCLADDKDLG